MLAALHVHDALRRRVEQRVDHEIREEIDFVDVENVAIRAREQPGPEIDRAALQRGAQIDCADDVVELRVRR